LLHAEVQSRARQSIVVVIEAFQQYMGARDYRKSTD